MYNTKKMLGCISLWLTKCRAMIEVEKTLYLVRHAQSEIQGTLLGPLTKKKWANFLAHFKQTNEPALAKVGWDQLYHAEKVFQILEERQERLDPEEPQELTIYCSPAKRALQSAWGLTQLFRISRTNVTIKIKFLWTQQSSSSKFKMKYGPNCSTLETDLEWLKGHHEEIMKKLGAGVEDNPLKLDYEDVREDLSNGAMHMGSGVRDKLRGKKKFWKMGDALTQQTRTTVMQFSLKKLHALMDAGESPLVVCHGSAISTARQEYDIRLNPQKIIMNAEVFKFEFIDDNAPILTRFGGILVDESTERYACDNCGGLGEFHFPQEASDDVYEPCKVCGGHGRSDKVKTEPWQYADDD